VIYDLALVGAVVSAGAAYAMGARLAHHIGSWQVICWALLMAFPVLLPPVAWSIYRTGFEPHLPSLLGFLYVSCISMFLAFFAWYRGLALGGVAKVGLIQLLQPFFTLGFSVTLLGEPLELSALLVACLVTLSVFAAIRSRVKTNASVSCSGT